MMAAADLLVAVSYLTFKPSYFVVKHLLKYGCRS